jgi:hypothetical protein
LKVKVEEYLPLLITVLLISLWEVVDPVASISPTAISKKNEAGQLRWF